MWMIPNQTRDYYERNQRNNPIEDLNITEKKSTKKKKKRVKAIEKNLSN